MTTRQLFGLFLVPRNPDGSPEMDPDLTPEEPDPERVYRRYLFLNGTTDRATQDRLWAEKRARDGERRRQHRH